MTLRTRLSVLILCTDAVLLDVHLGLSHVAFAEPLSFIHAAHEIRICQGGREVVAVAIAAYSDHHPPSSTPD